MASLVCEDCKSPVQWSAPGCAACGAMFREIRCAACKYVGSTDQFPQRRCPRCATEKFLTISRADEIAEDVGSEAFFGDGQLEDEIARNLADPQPKRPEPPKRIRSQSGDQVSKQADDREHDPSQSSTPQQGDPRPVLKRKQWRTESPEPDEEPASKPVRKSALDRTRDESTTREPEAQIERPHRSVSNEPVATVNRRRFHIELSPKAHQLLRWSAMALPVLLVVVLALVWFGGSGGGRGRRASDALFTGLDPGTLEAEAARLYQAATDFYRAGQTEPAVDALQQIVSRFPLTATANQAREALDRIGRGEPLFAGLIAQLPPSPESNPQPAVAPAEKPAQKKRPSIGIPTQRPPTQPPAGSSDENLLAGSAPRDPRAPPPGSSLAKSDATPRALPRGFEAVPAAGVHSSGWPIEIRCIKDGSHMMLVPAGEFEMGAADGELNMRPPHRVALKTYYIDRFEITLGQYKLFLEQKQLEGSAYAPLSAAAQSAVESDRHPVVGVAWRDTHAYGLWSGKSLPSEAQWEKAARGGDARRHPWGSGEPIWERTRSPKQLDRVGSFAWDVSPFGCFDMSGNAWEWCADWYDPNYYATSPVEDPEGPKTWLPPVQYTEPEKTLRGGSPDWLVMWRAPCGLNEAPLHVGFRGVLNVERIPTLSPPPPPTAPQLVQPVQRQPAQIRIPPGGYKF